MELYGVINSGIKIYLGSVMRGFGCFMSLGEIFLILKGIGKKGKWIVRLCCGRWGNVVYGMLYLICGKRGCGCIEVVGVWLIGCCERKVWGGWGLY